MNHLKRRTNMRGALAVLAIGAAAAVVALSANPAEAGRTGKGAWCADFSGGNGTDCSYATYRQCMVTIWGVGGYCIVNPRYSFSAEPAYPRTRRR